RSRRWPPLSGCARAPPVPESTGRSAGCARTSWSRRSTMGNELQRLRAALLEEAPQPDAALGARVLANPGEPVARWPRTAGGGGGVAAARRGGGRRAAGPGLRGRGPGRGVVPGAAAPPRPGPTASPIPPPVPTPPVPQEDLAAAHLDNVAQLVQPFHVTAEGGG